MGEVSFELQAYTISEDAGIVEVCVLITGEVGAPLSITLTTQNGTALGKKNSPKYYPICSLCTTISSGTIFERLDIARKQVVDKMFRPKSLYQL